jgi:ribonucleoside-triphosphate reductase
VDVESSINEYLTRADWRVNANANQGYSLGGLILNVAGKVTANYWLSHVYTPEIGEAHRDGDIHIHDLDMLSGYCAGWSLRTLLHEGLNGVPGKVEAGRPSTCRARSGRSSTSSARCRTNGPARRRSLVRHLHGALRAQGRLATSRCASACRS